MQPHSNNDTEKNETHDTAMSSVDTAETVAETPDDISLEEIGEDGERIQDSKDIVRKLRTRIKELEREKREYLEGWQRLKADFANYKRRIEDEQKELRRFANEDLIMELLPVLESFQMAFRNTEAWEKVDQNWRKGVEYIHAQLSRVLSERGLEEVRPAIGDRFDPALHTSIGTLATDDSLKYDTIADVVQGGYRLSGKLIRSPRVHVYAPPPDDTKKEDMQKDS